MDGEREALSEVRVHFVKANMTVRLQLSMKAELGLTRRKGSTDQVSLDQKYMTVCLATNGVAGVTDGSCHVWQE